MMHIFFLKCLSLYFFMFKFQVHLNTNVHKENIQIKSTKSAPVQKLLSEFSNNSFSQFSFDLCEAF
jgi:hypothetical protein